MKAQNRKEIFLKALANGEEPKIKPLTREEALLKKQAKRESESSSGGEHRCDWNKMDNRPFGEEVEVVKVIAQGNFDFEKFYIGNDTYVYRKTNIDTGEFIINTPSDDLANNSIPVGMMFRITIGNQTFIQTATNPSGGTTTSMLGATDCSTYPYYIKIGSKQSISSEVRVSTDFGDGDIINLDVLVERIEIKLFPLDEKFIPETIARKSDISGGGGGNPDIITCMGVADRNGNYLVGSTYDELVQAFEDKKIIQFYYHTGAQIVHCNLKYDGIEFTFYIGSEQYAMYENGTIERVTETEE